MIKNSKSLLISIGIHICVLISLLYVWDNYIRTQDKQLDNKIKTNLPTAVAANTIEDIEPVKELIQKKDNLVETNTSQELTNEPSPEQKPEPEPTIAIAKTDTILKEKPSLKKTKQEKQIVKKTKEQKPKKVVKKYDLELKKMDGFLIEQVPSELAYVRKRPTPKRKHETKPIKKNSVKKTYVSQKNTTKNTKPKQKSNEKTYLQINKKEILKLVQKHLFYPSSAKKKGITGEVTIKFKLATNRNIYDIKVIKSNNLVLSRAAMKTISDLSGKLPKPKKNIVLHLPVKYALN